MGRLFWKLFFAIFLALISTVLTVGHVALWEVNQKALHQLEPSKRCASTKDCAPPTVKIFHKTQPESVRNVASPRKLFEFPLSALGVLIFISASFSAILAWSISHPIKLLLQHLKNAADGDFVTKVSPKIPSSHDEFSALGTAIDAMTQRVDGMMKSQSKMLHHVSHELRSPLARIQMAVGLVIQDPQKMQNSLQRVELEAVRMERMISELLEIFRFESGMHKLDKSDVDLKVLLTGIVGDVLFEKHEANIRLEMPDDMVLIEGQLELLQRAIDNVVRNAVKYGPEEGVVSIELQHSARTGEVTLEVQDQGQGVEPHELEHIFRPFVRGRRASQVEGHGIGLAMTKHIVEAHGGFVRATNLNPQGFLIRIHLPAPHLHEVQETKKSV